CSPGATPTLVGLDRGSSAASAVDGTRTVLPRIGRAAPPRVRPSRTTSEATGAPSCQRRLDRAASARPTRSADEAAGDHLEAEGFVGALEDGQHTGVDEVPAHVVLLGVA